MLTHRRSQARYSRARTRELCRSMIGSGRSRSVVYCRPRLDSIMSVHIALLGGINVGGHNKVAMSELRDLLAALGFAGARSLLQSGNLVFESPRLTGAALERLLEVETAKRLEVSVEYLVRTADEWERIVARNPFPNEARRDPSHLV